MKKLISVLLVLFILAGGALGFWYYRSVTPVRNFQKGFLSAETLEFQGTYIVSDGQLPEVCTRVQGRINQGDLYLNIMDFQGSSLACYYDVDGSVRWDLKPAVSHLLTKYEVPEKFSSQAMKMIGVESIIVSQEQLDFLVKQLERFDSVPEVMRTAPGSVRMQLSSLLSGELSPAGKPEYVFANEALDGYCFCKSKDMTGRIIGIREGEEGKNSLLYLSQSPSGSIELQLNCTFLQTAQAVPYPETLLSQKSFDILKSTVEWIDKSVHLITEFYNYLEQAQS